MKKRYIEKTIYIQIATIYWLLASMSVHAAMNACIILIPHPLPRCRPDVQVCHMRGRKTLKTEPKQKLVK
jgi:hypothetical protein